MDFLPFSKGYMEKIAGESSKRRKSIFDSSEFGQSDEISGEVSSEDEENPKQESSNLDLLYTDWELKTKYHIFLWKLPRELQDGNRYYQRRTTHRNIDQAFGTVGGDPF